MCGRKELSTTTGSPIGYHILGVPYTVHHPSHQTLHFPKQRNETYNDGYQSNQFIARRRNGHHCRIRIDISCHIFDLDIEILLLVRRRVNQSRVMCELYESREQTVPAMKLTCLHVYIYLFISLFECFLGHFKQSPTTSIDPTNSSNNMFTIYDVQLRTGSSNNGSNTNPPNPDSSSEHPIVPFSTKVRSIFLEKVLQHEVRA